MTSLSKCDLESWCFTIRLHEIIRKRLGIFMSSHVASNSQKDAGKKNTCYSINDSSGILTFPNIFFFSGCYTTLDLSPLHGEEAMELAGGSFTAWAGHQQARKNIGPCGKPWYKLNSRFFRGMFTYIFTYKTQPFLGVANIIRQSIWGWKPPSPKVTTGSFWSASSGMGIPKRWR